MPVRDRQPLSSYQSQYFAWLLTRRAASNSVDALASTLVDAQVDLNPHQVEAALFACRNPLSRGVLLADVVGLGKAIEAGLVISQRWAERQRHILIVVPANSRVQRLTTFAHSTGISSFSMKRIDFEMSTSLQTSSPARCGMHCQRSTPKSCSLRRRCRIRY